MSQDGYGGFKSEGWTWRRTGMYGRVEGGANSWIKRGFYEDMISLFLWSFGLARDLKMQPWRQDTALAGRCRCELL